MDSINFVEYSYVVRFLRTQKTPVALFYELPTFAIQSRNHTAHIVSKMYLLFPARYAHQEQRNVKHNYYHRRLDSKIREEEVASRQLISLLN
jgi:hypothetical protein